MRSKCLPEERCGRDLKCAPACLPALPQPPAIWGHCGLHACVKQMSSMRSQLLVRGLLVGHSMGHMANER